MSNRTNRTTEVDLAASQAGTLAGAEDASQAPASTPASAPAPAPVPAKPEAALAKPSADPAVPRDEHHGKGGEYHLIDGRRVLVEHNAEELAARGHK